MDKKTKSSWSNPKSKAKANLPAGKAGKRSDKSRRFANDSDKSDSKKTQPKQFKKPTHSRSRHASKKALVKTEYTVLPAKKDGKLRIYALGGLEEVGRNMTVFEYENDIIILDIGNQFPDEGMHGIDYIIPNVSSLKNKKKNIRAVVITHGHLDHIGAAPLLLPELGNPLVVAAPMTLALLKKQIENHNNKFTPKTLVIKDIKKPVTLGKFKVNFFAVTHSIKDALGVIIETPVVNVIHPGDWRYDLDPVEGPITDLNHLAKWSQKGKPSILMMESLGSTQEGHQGSEREVYENIKKIITQSKGRVIIGTFSSMLERIGQIFEIAERAGKKVALDGYSMKANVEIGKQFGFIKAKKNTFIPIERVHDYPKNKVVIVCTGVQGEGRAVMSRIATGDHRYVKIEPNDTIIFSSSVIPGNERTIQSLKDSLYRQGANVFHKEIMDVHAGGHGKREDIKLLLKQVKPDFLIPVYANHYLLREAEKLAIDNGFNKSKIFVADNGQIIEFDKHGGRLTKNKVDTSYVFVDGLGVGDVSHIVLRDRQMMAEDGMIVVIATIDKRKGNLVQNPDLISRGFIYMKENKKLIEQTRDKAKKIFSGDLKGGVDENYYKDRIRNEIGQFLYQKTKRRPMVLPVIIQV